MSYSEFSTSRHSGISMGTTGELTEVEYLVLTDNHYELGREVRIWILFVYELVLTSSIMLLLKSDVNDIY